MSNFQQIGKAFVDHYYQVFDQNRQNLANLYQNNSLLTWENDQIQGKVNILKKFGELPFKTVKHELSTTDCQPSPSGGIIVFVGGIMTIDNEQQFRFSEVFHLVASGGSQFFLTNHLFRLQM